MWLGAHAHAFSPADADTIFEAHTKAFYRVENGKGWHAKHTDGGRADFWMQAEMLEMVLDVHARTRSPKQLKMFDELFHGFIAKHGRTWERNDFNDDIMWMVIACTRAHLATKNAEYLSVAKDNFDLCYKRAISRDLGGGLWWKTDNKSKNACVNGPGAIAAFLLGLATRDASYTAKAKELFLWERDTLFDKKTGKVADNINLSGKVATFALTYNQGTFVGAANLLGYHDDAKLAALYTMNKLCKDGYLPASGETGDGGGFNGIGVRWIALYMKNRKEQATFEPWLQKNAEAAWQARRAEDNLSWCAWPKPTPPGARHAWGCSNAVVIMQAVRPTEPATVLPAVNDLPVLAAMPDPLTGSDGNRITTPAQWPARRAAMKRIIEHYGLGHAPPPPGNVTGQEVEATLLADGKVSYRRVHLTFGPGGKLGFDLSIFLPAGSTGSKGPFPTIVHPRFSAIGKTQPQDPKPAAGRNDTPEAVAQQFAQVLGRGYAVAAFFYQDCGADLRDYRQTGFFPAYPDYDWADLAAWAWGMSRCVDYLEQQSFVDKSKFIAAGHSRLGKATLVAGAFDERFALVAPAGSGCGGTGAYRFNGKGRGGREGLEDVVRNFPQWEIPRVAEFSGQVEKLPFDQHWLISMVAPRRFIAADGLSDTATSVNALVQSYQAAKPVYAMLGVPDHLGIHFRPGGHQFAQEDWNAVLDFAEQQLRGVDVKRRFDELPSQEPGR